ncbi:hypothetical protein [Laceyella putida]|uniref:Lipoprotein n=1 Tax=Laceyella putida TaxID=110101 RepID=A0ABW2RG61_9BACL
MGEQQGKSKRLVQLFVAAMITVPLAGCGEDDVELCFDDNRDGRCDDDGSYYDPNNYVVKKGKRFAYIKSDSRLVTENDIDFKKGIGGKSKGFGG